MASRFLDKAGKGFDEDAETTVAHLEILANVDIEKVPFPEQENLAKKMRGRFHQAQPGLG